VTLSLPVSCSPYLSLFVYLSFYLIRLSHFMFLVLPVLSLSIYLSSCACLSLFLPVSLSVPVSLFSGPVSLLLPVSLSNLSPPLCLSVCLSVYHSFCASLPLPLSLFLFCACLSPSANLFLPLILPVSLP